MCSRQPIEPDRLNWDDLGAGPPRHSAITEPVLVGIIGEESDWSACIDAKVFGHFISVSFEGTNRLPIPPSFRAAAETMIVDGLLNAHARLYRSREMGEYVNGAWRPDTAMVVHLGTSAP